MQTGGRSHAVRSNGQYVYAAGCSRSAGNQKRGEYIRESVKRRRSRGIYVVNGYELSRKTDIVDYGGLYSRTKSDIFERNQESGRTDRNVRRSGKFYYQGNLAHNDLPWLIGIDYELNGKISADALAGKKRGNKDHDYDSQNQNVEQGFLTITCCRQPLH